MSSSTFLQINANAYLVNTSFATVFGRFTDVMYYVFKQFQYFRTRTIFLNKHNAIEDNLYTIKLILA